MISFYLTVGAIIGIVAMIVGIILCKKMEDDKLPEDLSKNPYIIRLSIWCLRYGYGLYVYECSNSSNYIINVCKGRSKFSFTIEDSSDAVLPEAIFQVIDYVLHNERKENQNAKKTLQ